MAYISTVTNTGLDLISNRIKGVGNEPKYVAWGTGANETTVLMTALQSEGSESRISGTSTQETTTTTNDTYQVVGIITCASADKAITEVALFDASTVGNMFMRSNFPVINVAVGDSIQFTIKTIFDQA